MRRVSAPPSPSDPVSPSPLEARVAASSANLGPGFDHLGLALELELRVTLHPETRDRIVYRGVGGEGAVPDTPDNLIHRGYRAVWRELGRTPPTVRFEVDNPIPLARGLGSSSAALVAGAALGDGLAARSGAALGRDALFQLCARLEGHPDNIAPAVYGGFTVSAPDPDGGYTCAHLPLPDRWRLLFGVPAYELSTEAARRVLPERYPRSAAVATGARSALWALAVARDDPALLRVAARDELHEPYREPLVPGLAEARPALRAAGAWAVFLSGAGPTVGVVCGADREAACRAALERFVAAGEGGAGRVLAPRPGRGYAVAARATSAG